MNVILEFTSTWQPSDPDGTICRLCGDPIYSTMYRLLYMINGVVKKDDIVLCESCYAEIKNPD